MPSFTSSSLASTLPPLPSSSELPRSGTMSSAHPALHHNHYRHHHHPDYQEAAQWGQHDQPHRQRGELCSRRSQPARVVCLFFSAIRWKLVYLHNILIKNIFSYVCNKDIISVELFCVGNSEIICLCFPSKALNLSSIYDHQYLINCFLGLLLQELFCLGHITFLSGNTQTQIHKLAHE